MGHLEAGNHPYIQRDRERYADHRANAHEQKILRLEIVKDDGSCGTQRSTNANLLAQLGDPIARKAGDAAQCYRSRSI